MSDINPAASAAGRALRALRKTHEGHPRVYHQCRHCDGDFRAKNIGTTRPDAIRTVDLQAQEGRDLAVGLVFIRFNNWGRRSVRIKKFLAS
jgi:hypothetical protein